MPANGPLYLAAGLVTVIGLAHSCLGERFVIGRLLALPDLPRLGGDVGYMRRIVRYART